MSDKKNIVGFKKFSDIKSGKKKEEIDPSYDNSTELNLPMNPNMHKSSNKIEKFASRKGIITNDQDINLPSEEDDMNNNIELKGEKTHEKVDFTGKVAKFPKNTKASKAYNFLENVKVSKKSIWYIMVEKDNGLQMVKYNYKEGVDINKFVNELKSYYISKNKENKSICEAISKMSVDGNDKYSMIRNIPLVEVDGRKMISVITQDLIKLLSK